jgi:hypothetical protein
VPPYDRDAGMTQREAQALEELVNRAAVGATSVEREGRYYVVVVDAANDRYTLRDEADWVWLRRQVDGD